MAGEIVKYDNRLNNVSFSGTKITDNLLKLFFTIVYKAKDVGTNEIVITFDEMKKLTCEKGHYTDAQYKQLITSLYTVLLNLRIKFDNGMWFGEYNIFTGYEGRLDENCIVVQVTKPATQLFNSLEKNFTRFELEEFVRLPGIYPKHLYRLLKTFRHMGQYNVPMEKFREYLDVPESYATRDITRRILDPGVETLKEYVPEFKDLTYRYGFKGRKAVQVMFSWSPERRYIDIKAEEQREKGMQKLRDDVLHGIPDDFDISTIL